MRKLFKETANYVMLLPKLDPFCGKEELPSHFTKSSFQANSVPGLCTKLWKGRLT
jgi:hypothetical protein